MAEDPLAFDPTMKKKKKKKIELSAIDDTNKDAETTQNETVETTAQMDVDSGVALDDFSNLKKKKKKNLIIEDADHPDGEPVPGVAGQGDPAYPDYTYDELLARVFNIMREKNPDMTLGEKKKFKLSPPQVGRAGSKKTAFANFAEICKQLRRTPKHLLQFLLAELGTSGSIDGNDQLIIKGRFQQKHIESVLRKYIKEYVTCHTCHSAETELQKDTRLFFLQCSTCGSRCSVVTIKSGYQAVTTRRAQARTAAQT